MAYNWCGKTLTSFKAAQLVAELDDVDKVMFVVDRHDLDTQTQSEYEAFEPGAVDSTDNTDELVKRLHGNSKIIITTIQKLNAAVSKQWYSRRIEEIRHARIVMILMSVIAVISEIAIRISSDFSTIHRYSDSQVHLSSLRMLWMVIQQRKSSAIASTSI